MKCMRMPINIFATARENCGNNFISLLLQAKVMVIVVEIENQLSFLLQFGKNNPRCWAQALFGREEGVFVKECPLNVIRHLLGLRKNALSRHLRMVCYNSLLHVAFVFSLIITFNQLCTTQRFQGLFTNGMERDFQKVNKK